MKEETVKFEHPCKDICSGWQQGFEKGREVEKAQGDHFTNEEHAEVLEENKKLWKRNRKATEVFNHILAMGHLTAGGSTEGWVCRFLRGEEC